MRGGGGLHLGQVPLVLAVANAWEWTIQNRRGLFSNKYEADSHLHAKSGGPAEDADLLDAIAAHHLWLSFWVETWQVPMESSHITCLLNTWISVKTADRCSEPGCSNPIPLAHSELALRQCSRHESI